MNLVGKFKDWKNRLQDRHMLSIIVTSFVIILALLGYTHTLCRRKRMHTL